MVGMGHMLKPGPSGVRKQVLHPLMQLGLVLFDCQDVICLLLDNLMGDLPLTAHRIDGHNAPRYVQQPQQLRNGRDLIGFFFRLHLPQTDMVLSRPGTYQMNGALTQLVVM